MSCKWLLLTTLFNISLKDTTLPDSWKDAHVLPIFKKSCRTKPSNHHPVSLTSVISKILIKNHLMLHLESNCLLSDVLYLILEDLMDYNFGSGQPMD